MIGVIGVLIGAFLRLFRPRRILLLENLALRQQLAVFKRRDPSPQLAAFDKLFWVLARRFWSGWKRALVMVSPETVVRWHRSGFVLYWRLISRARRVIGRKRISKELRDLIFRMVVQKPTWGAPRIHGELLMLGFDVSERTISRWMRLAFLRNHREAIVAMDFFTVPTIRFDLLYCFFVISHGRGRVLHFNVTRHPTGSWIVPQLREAFPYQSASRFLIFDRDAKYGLEVPIVVRSMNIRPVRTSFQSPWQNGIAERWIESCRHDLLDHIIALNERHLKRLLSHYVCYYHEDRTHISLNKGTPAGRVQSMNQDAVLSRARLGGLHHRYDRAA